MTLRSDNRSADPCWRTALRLLARRDHFSTELAQKLREKGFSGQEIASTIERLMKMRYLDDRRALAAFAEEMKRHQKGFLLLLKKLMERDARRLFDETELRVAYPLAEERQIARELSQKMRWAPEENRRRLHNRGFSGEAIGGTENDL